MSDVTSEHPQRLSRRQLCAGACRAATCAALGILVEACGAGGGSSSPTAPSSFAQLPIVDGTVVAGGVSVPIGAGSVLSSVGGVALVQSTRGDFLLAHTGTNAFSALPATCTHQACTITIFSGGVYICPCHGSQFTTSGQVLSGPAFVSLRQLATSVANDTVTIVV